MPKIFEWLGSIMFLVALIEFIPNPRKALESIPQVLATNPKIVNGRLVLPKVNGNGEKKAKNPEQFPISQLVHGN